MSITAGFKKSVGIAISDDEPQCVSPDSQASVFVIFTSAKRTLKALEKAGELANSLGAGIVIVATQIVSYVLPLDEPSIAFEFAVRRLEIMASQFPLKTQVSAYLCRNPLEALKRILTPDSPVVIGVRKRWWPTRDEKLARKLRRAGYVVTLVETE
jgi:hypothetical protein